MQDHYNLVYREEEREMIPFCLDQGIGVVPYSPLARGLLAGNRERGGAERSVRAGSDKVLAAHYDDADFDVVDAVRAVATERGLPPAQIALAWLLGRPAVAPPSSERRSSATSTTRSRRSALPSATRRSRGWRRRTGPIQ
jgi:1-deoxyxylulose-5-phosphate synthase